MVCSATQTYQSCGVWAHWSLHAAGDPAAEDWVAVKALAVLAGGSGRAAAAITAEAVLTLRAA